MSFLQRNSSVETPECDCLRNAEIKLKTLQLLASLNKYLRSVIYRQTFCTSYKWNNDFCRNSMSARKRAGIGGLWGQWKQDECDCMRGFFFWEIEKRRRWRERGRIGARSVNHCDNPDGGASRDDVFPTFCPVAAVTTRATTHHLAKCRKWQRARKTYAQPKWESLDLSF